MATATVLINEHTPDVLHLNALTPGDAEAQAIAADSSAVDTQVEILKSRALAAGVVDQLHLDQDPEFNAALRRPGLLARLKGFLMGWAASPAPPMDPAQQKQREYEAVVNGVMGDLEVKRTGLTYTINVTSTAFEPGKAQALRIANTFTQRYLTEASTPRSTRRRRRCRGWTRALPSSSSRSRTPTPRSSNIRSATTCSAARDRLSRSRRFRIWTANWPRPAQRTPNRTRG